MHRARAAVLGLDLMGSHLLNTNGVLVFSVCFMECASVCLCSLEPHPEVLQFRIGKGHRVASVMLGAIKPHVVIHMWGWNSGIHTCSLLRRGQIPSPNCYFFWTHPIISGLVKTRFFMCTVPVTCLPGIVFATSICFPDPLPGENNPCCREEE